MKIKKIRDWVYSQIDLWAQDNFETAEAFSTCH